MNCWKVFSELDTLAKQQVVAHWGCVRATRGIRALAAGLGLLLLPLCACSTSKPSKAPPCLDRVAFLDGRQNAPLGELEGGGWVALGDAALLSQMDRDPGTALLFFSTADYATAIRGLPEAEVKAVVRGRLQLWSPKLPDKGLSWLEARERQILVLAAQAGESHAFTEVLQLLAQINDGNRYDAISLGSLLVVVLEGDAKIRAEAQDVLSTNVAKASPSLAQLAQRLSDASQKSGVQLGPVLDHFGYPQFAGMLPFTGIGRGVWVSPAPEGLLTALRETKENYALWRGGVVAQLAPSDLGEWTKGATSVRVLYPDATELTRHLFELTPAQRDREFAERLGAGQGAVARSYRESLDSAWLWQHLLRRTVLVRAEGKNQEVVQLLSPQVAAEESALARELAQSSPWITELSSGKSKLESLEQVLTCTVADAVLLTALALRPELASHPGLEVLKTEFARIREVNQAQLERVRRLIGK